MATNALNRLEPAYFIVDITGAVDNLSPEFFAAENSDTFPSTLAFSLGIERTNMRYEEVIRAVSENIQPLFTAAIATTGRTEDVPATAIQFTLPYDRPEYLSTEDEDNPGTTLTGVDALTRYVARGLVDDVVNNRQIYDPETTDDSNTAQILEVTATKLYADVSTAEGNITVTEVADLVD